MSTTIRKAINLQEIFDLIDKQGRGTVEVGKIGDLLRYAGLNPTEKTCDKIIKKLDSKQSINLNDFIEIYGDQQDSSLEFNSISLANNQNSTLNSMINAVRTFDHQGTGFITLTELKFVLTGLGDKMKDAEFDDLRQFMEISPNGQVSYEQFITSVNES